MLLLSFDTFKLFGPVLVLFLFKLIKKRIAHFKPTEDGDERCGNKMGATIFLYTVHLYLKFMMQNIANCFLLG